MGMLLSESFAPMLSPSMAPTVLPTMVEGDSFVVIPVIGFRISSKICALLFSLSDFVTVHHSISFVS